MVSDEQSEISTPRDIYFLNQRLSLSDGFHAEQKFPPKLEQFSKSKCRE